MLTGHKYYETERGETMTKCVCGHHKNEHVDLETKELGGCLHTTPSISEDTMFGDMCNCNHYQKQNNR